MGTVVGEGGGGTHFRRQKTKIIHMHRLIKVRGRPFRIWL